MNANEISIHYQVAGTGPSVVLLHEMGGTLDSWDGIAPALAEGTACCATTSAVRASSRCASPYHRHLVTTSKPCWRKRLPPPITSSRSRPRPCRRWSDDTASIRSELRVLQPLRGGRSGRVAALDERPPDRARRHAGRAPSRSTIRIRPTSVTARPMRPIAAATWRTIPCALPRSIVRSRSPTSRNSARTCASRPWWSPAGSTRCARPPGGENGSPKIIPGARFELIDAVHMMPAQAPEPLLSLLKDFLGAQVASTADWSCADPPRCWSEALPGRAARDPRGVALGSTLGTASKVADVARSPQGHHPAKRPAASQSTATATAQRCASTGPSRSRSPYGRARATPGAASASTARSAAGPSTTRSSACCGTSRPTWPRAPAGRSLIGEAASRGAGRARAGRPARGLERRVLHAGVERWLAGCGRRLGGEQPPPPAVVAVAGQARARRTAPRPRGGRGAGADRLGTVGGATGRPWCRRRQTRLGDRRPAHRRASRRS